MYPHNDVSVSVIITTLARNKASLERAVRSVASQSYDINQLIIVNTSGSEHMNSEIRAMFCDISNMDVVSTKKLVNGAAGRNFGFQYTKSDFVCFLDDDDFWNPDKIVNQIDVVDGDTVLVWSPYISHFIDGSEIEFNKSFKTENYYSELLGSNVVGCTSFPMISSSAFNNVGGFDDSFESNQEWDLWIRLSKIGKFKRTGYLAGIKYECESGITNCRLKRKQGWISFFRKYAFDLLLNLKSFSISSGFFYREMWNKKYYVLSYFGFLTHSISRICSMVGFPKKRKF